jgi:hypothetical protein
MALGSGNPDGEAEFAAIGIGWARHAVGPHSALTIRFHLQVEI